LKSAVSGVPLLVIAAGHTLEASSCDGCMTELLSALCGLPATDAIRLNGILWLETRQSLAAAAFDVEARPLSTGSSDRCVFRGDLGTDSGGTRAVIPE
jgi:hypothetical protein